MNASYPLIPVTPLGLAVGSALPTAGPLSVTARPVAPSGNAMEAGSVTAAVWSVLSTVSLAACAYHGYKRNDSVGWAVVWGLLGGIFPVISVAIAAAQGFGQPHYSRRVTSFRRLPARASSRKNPSGRSRRRARRRRH